MFLIGSGPAAFSTNQNGLPTTTKTTAKENTEGEKKYQKRFTENDQKQQPQHHTIHGFYELNKRPLCMHFSVASHSFFLPYFFFFFLSFFFSSLRHSSASQGRVRDADMTHVL